MAVFRVERNKGLLSQMLSLPEDWDYTLAGLSQINRESIDAIRTAVWELEKAGYIKRQQGRDEKGKMTAIDRLIIELYNYKAQNSSNPCMLIIDECQEVNLSQKSPLVKLLKQGRKCGIMVVLISQFLTAEDGKNIEDTLRQCETKVAFKPGDDKRTAKHIGYDLKDSSVRDAVLDINNYQCIVKGKFCTDTFAVDYPLILKIPK